MSRSMISRPTRSSSSTWTSTRISPTTPRPITSLIIQAIADRDERYLVTEENIDAGVAALTGQVENLDPETLF